MTRGTWLFIHGIGYANSPRSHFRSMDIWHTAEPNKVGTEGWLGKVVRDLDPKAENVVKTVNFGQGLPRALALPGVPVASVSELESYGLLTGISGQEQRSRALDHFSRMYSPAIGTGEVMEYLGQTGLDALKGADILKVAPQKYSSTVEYPYTPIARSLRGISQVFQADLGTQVFYCQHGSFDTHANELPVHAKLWDRGLPGRGVFLRRPQRAQPRRQPHHVHVYRVRTTREGQRDRQRPWGRGE